MKNLRLPFYLLAFLLIGSSGLNADQLATAKVLSITGTVTKSSLSGVSSQLLVGEILKEGDTINVSALSNAKLVFSNGSTIDVRQNTNFIIKEFEQDSFVGEQTYDEIKADPSKSQVVLVLNYGEIDGHVKKLQKDSKFDIQTPVGTVSILGTKFNVAIKFDVASGEFFISVLNKDGTVVFSSNQVPTGSDQAEHPGSDQKSETTIKREAVPQGKTTSEAVPQGKTLSIRVGSSSLLGKVLLNATLKFIPEADRPDAADVDKVIIKIVTPVPEDPDLQVVSPNT